MRDGEKNDRIAENKRQLSQWLIAAVAVAIIAGCYWLSIWSEREIDKKMREKLLFQADAIARMVNTDRVKSLSFTADDRNNVHFQRLQSQMAAYADTMGNISLYSLALSGDQLLFGPESIPENDPLSSPPGTVYQKSDIEQKRIFENGVSFTEGPVRDEYGVFVSAIAPVKDPRTGKVLMTIGIDVEAKDWENIVSHEKRIPILAASILLLILMGGGSVIKYRANLPLKWSNRFRFAEALLAGLFGLTLTFLATWVADNVESRSRNNTFSQLAEAQAGVIVEAMTSMRDYHLAGLAGFFKGSHNVERQEFQTYASTLVKGDMALWEWIPAVSYEQKEQFEAEICENGSPYFFIHTNDANGQHIPVKPRETYYPVVYVAPEKDGDSILGLDMGAYPILRATMDEAART